MINYEQEVKKKRPYACYVYFAGALEKHHIRLYTGDYPVSLGTSNKSETDAWQSAYEQLKKEGKI